MIWKVLFVILAVFLLLGAFYEPINDGIKAWRTNDTTEADSADTAAGVTTANVTLSGELYQDNVSEVISISSNVTEDSPAATSYTTATRVLLVSGLVADASRTLTTNYYAETESSIIQVIGPYLSFLIIGGLLFAIIIGLFSKKRYY